MQIKGIYAKTVYRNIDNGFTVFSFKLSEGIPDYDRCYINCSGIVKASLIGMPLLLEGKLEKHNNETSFAFTEITPYCRNVADAEAVFSSPVFNKLPKDKITTLVTQLGPNPFEWDSFPDLYVKLTTVDGIGPKRAQAIIDNISIYRIQNELLDYIYKFGEQPSSAAEVIGQYKVETLTKLKEHPYVIGHRMGLSFQCCDAMGKDNGFDANNTERLTAIIFDVMDRAYKSGNTYFPLDRVLNGVNYISKHYSSYPDAEISMYKVFALLNSQKSIVSYIKQDGEVNYYLNYSYDNENLLADNVIRLQKAKNNVSVDIKKIIKECENTLGIKYSEKQKECFKFLSSEGIKIITGGPGTGKSTVINGLIHAFEMLYPHKTINMMAPTGRASQKIAEITHRSAGTIHRILGINPIQEHKVISKFFSDFPADLIVVDETSMLDNEIAGQVFKAAKGNSTILLVGDIDQLPSVGAGNVLKDLIESDIIDVVHLNVNYRQGGLSTIAQNAEKIKKGYTDLVTDDTFHIIKCKNFAEMQKLASETFFNLYDVNEPFETQMLNATKEGESGVFKFNRLLQKGINKTPTSWQTKRYEYKKGDKVIITMNNYDQNCFNGDIGLIKSISEEEMEIKIGSDTVYYPHSQLSEVHLAYAMSIHKSQGSEYNNVIICLPETGNALLKRNLIYTAITRAKKNVFIYYIDNSLNEAIMTTSTNNRLTNLNELLERKSCA